MASLVRLGDPQRGLRNDLSGHLSVRLPASRVVVERAVRRVDRRKIVEIVQTRGLGVADPVPAPAPVIEFDAGVADQVQQLGL